MLNGNSIGAACARDLFAQGTSLALTYSANKAPVDQLADELRSNANGRKITVHRADMASDSDLNKLYEDIKS